MFGFFKRRKANLHEKYYRHGWDYAAGRIFEDGSLAIDILEKQVQCSRDFGKGNSFDEGICAAIKVWEAANVELNTVADEMRKRLVNHGRNTSPTLIAWADRIDLALKGHRNV